MKKNFKIALAVLLSVVLAVSALTFTVSAYNANYQSETHTVFKHTEQTLAPGIEYYNNYAYAKSDGNQMVYYVTTADISRNDVVVQTSYKDQYENGQFGMAKLTEQIAYANALYTDPSNERFISEHYNVVSGVNASFYNMQTGQPSGVVYLDGMPIGESASYNTYFAIVDNGDGTKSAVIDYVKATSAVTPHTSFASIQDHVLQACAGNTMLVYDGQACGATESSYMTSRASRTCIGITEEGKVVTMVLDGRQEPFSCGGTSAELAQIMLEAGCKYAINLDGGGSTTFAARPEGEDAVRIVNRPSDGSERSISTGIIIASLAAPSNDFDHASLNVENEYITPGTSTAIVATGVSSSGSSAEIPEDVTYTATLGSVVNGEFISDGTQGVAEISMLYNGNVVGTTIVNVVVPDSIAFSAENITVPYGKSTELEIKAKKGLNEVKVKPADFNITLGNNEAGTLNGFTFTAAEESELAQTTVTAALIGTELTAEAGLLFGKGSEVIFDFEDGTTNGFGLSYSNYNYYLPNSKVFVATKENGKVHSGDYALGLNIDYSNSQESGYMMTALYQGLESGHANYYEGALKLGTWLYIPDEYVGLWVRWTISPISAINGDGTYTLASITSQTMDNTAGGTGVVYSFDEPGWHYLTADLSEYKGLAWRDFYYVMQFYISDRDGAAYGYYAKNNHNINGDFTVYMDDVTVDYSTVVEDREAPIFSEVILGDEGPHSNEGMVLNNGYVSNGYAKLDLSARVAENTTKSNYTGLDASSAKAYIDGNEVDYNYANGIISISDAYTFTEGQHKVKFVICDKAGNRASITRKFTVSNVSSREMIKIVPHDPTLDRILHGSLYWVDVVATDVGNVTKVITTLNLDSMSKWELEHMEVAEGIEASYEVVDAGDKIVKLTINKTDADLKGEKILVSIPVRAWYLDNANKRAPLSDKAWTYAEFKASKEFWPVATEVRVEQGLAYNAAGSLRYFTGDDVFVWSESWANYANMTATAEGKEYFNAWDGGHNHTEEAVEDLAPTCTEPGYTGRTFCQVCNSIVNWGTEVTATGHTYEVENGVLKCKDCGELFNGVFEEDGKLYEDGLTVTGWVDDHYYDDGVMMADVACIIEDEEYVFDENGDVIANDFNTYAGLVLNKDDGGIYFVALGEYKTGWQTSGDDYYYFSPADNKAVDGKQTIKEIGYRFENHVLVEGSWVERADGWQYMWAGRGHTAGWDVIDGERYLFNGNGYAMRGVVTRPHFDGVSGEKSFAFDDHGAWVGEDYTGLFEYDGETYYVENGFSVGGGLRKIGDDYYYFKSNMKAVKGEEYFISITNALMPAGKYVFDENGVMQITQTPVIEDSESDTDTTEIPEVKNGFITEADGVTYYYVDGVNTSAGLIQIDGDYYYVKSGGKRVENCDYFISNTNGLMPAGTYHFDENGKMQIAEPTSDSDVNTDTTATPEVKNGFVTEADGVTYYYVDGVNTSVGLIKIGDDFYYVKSGGKRVENCEYFISNTNGLMPAGKYFFDENGVMQIEEPSDIPEAKNGFVTEADGVTYYYVDGVNTSAGLIMIEGKLYYVKSGGKRVENCTYFISNTNGILDPGYYDFDADGVLQGVEILIC